jgi:hypothetical protein
VFIDNLHYKEVYASSRSIEEGHIMVEQSSADIFSQEWNNILEIFDSTSRMANRRVRSGSLNDLEEFTIDRENNEVRLYFKPGTTLEDDYGMSIKSQTIHYQNVHSSERDSNQKTYKR